QIIYSNGSLSIPSNKREDSFSSSTTSSISSEKQIKSLSPQVSKSPSPPSAPSAHESIKSHSPLPAQQRIKSPPSSLVQERVKTLSQEQGFIPIHDPKHAQLSSTHNEYDEDFSEHSRSPRHSPTKIDNNDFPSESIQEDIEDKPSAHESNQSSKSSAEEQ
ncbi:unnamed protein product, partial [Rotaria magnacalcarata]